MIILASASPRRRELLTMAGVEYQCIPADIEETVPQGTPTEKITEVLSMQKAGAVFAQHPEDTVIGSDTVVVIDGKVLGKPKSEEEAFTMLKQLSGRVHTVYTGVTLCSPKGSCSFTSHTEVEFYPLKDEEIRDYIRTGEPMDKAGSYGIQGYGCVLVKRINGDYFTVMGLPIAETVRALRDIM